jgi:hypothetical protein
VIGKSCDACSCHGWLSHQKLSSPAFQRNHSLTVSQTEKWHLGMLHWGQYVTSVIGFRIKQLPFS